MPHIMELKDGKLLTPFELRDVLDAVEDYAGEEARAYIEEYLEDNLQEVDDFEAQALDYERQIERSEEHHRNVLHDISEEVEVLDLMLHDARLNRRCLQNTVKNLRQMINQGL